MNPASMEKIYDIAGWVGMAVVLAVYSLVSLGWLLATSSTALLLNLLGGVGLALVSWRRRNYQPLLLNLIWSAIALFALGRNFLHA